MSGKIPCGSRLIFFWCTLSLGMTLIACGQYELYEQPDSPSPTPVLDADHDNYPISGDPPFDCDDHDPSIYPGAQEICDNTVDEDCDGQPNQSQPWYEDADGDGYGTSDRTEWTCMPPEGYVPEDGDCDDLDPRFNPDAGEEAGATDLNCDGVVSFSVDPDLGVESQEASSPLFGTLVIAIPPDSIDPASSSAEREADESDEVLLSVGLSDSLQLNSEIWTQQSLDQALLGPFFEFSPALTFSKPATVQFPVDPRLLDWQPDVDCDWLGVYQVGSSGQPLEDPLSTVECDLGQATLTVSMTHFSSYQVRGLSTLVELEPVYLDQDLPPQAPIVQVGSGVAFTRSWRFTLAGEPIADMKSAFEVEGGDSGFESISLIEARWDPDSELYPITLRAINQETSTRQIEALVYASSGGTRLETSTGVCPAQSTVCTASTIHDAGGEEIDCSHACGDGATCYDFDDDEEADIFECMTLEVAPDPDPVDDDGDTFTESVGDCDDTDPEVNPEAPEVCDGLDNDCDRRIDDEDASVQDQTPYYLDADGDGYGADVAAGESCSDPPSGYTRQSGDCNDTTSAARPGGQEVCDDLDNNCDGQTDEGLKSTFYQDSDGDGYGSSAASLVACSAPPGYTSTPGDCEDGDASVHPNAGEICDTKDNDCDGSQDEGLPTSSYYPDSDDDGYGRAGSNPVRACQSPEGYAANNEDCDDDASNRHPGAPEQCNELDDDCDETVDEGVTLLTWYRDSDEDGYGAASVTATYCAQPEGFVSDGTDCDDTSASTHPGALEVCNQMDDDCDKSVDEGVPTKAWYRDGDGDGYGTATDTLSDCAQPQGYVQDEMDCDDSNPEVHPGASERCNEIDDDCDGETDNMAIAAGLGHSLAVSCEQGTLWAWGDNTYGQLGDGTTTRRPTPILVPGMTGIVAISSGDGHSLALKDDGTVWSWGDNSNGQLGDGTTTPRLTPNQVQGLNDIVTISAGSEHSLALDADGTAWAWGANNYGQLGIGSTSKQTIRTRVENLTDVVAVAAGGSRSLALHSDGTAWEWGKVLSEKDGTDYPVGWRTCPLVGDYCTCQQTTPRLVPEIADAVAVATGGYHSLALTSEGVVLAWGWNNDGELGIGFSSDDPELYPVVSRTPNNVIAISAGSYHSLALVVDGDLLEVWAWGDNANGQLGDGTFTDNDEPVQTLGVLSAIAVAAGGTHSMTLNADSRNEVPAVWTWGSDGDGQLGDGSLEDRNTPLRIELAQ